MTSSQKKKLAKTGMTASMASLVLTGMKRGKLFRQLHVAGGIALIAFSVWHYSLYQGKKKGASRAQSQEHPDKA